MLGKIMARPAAVRSRARCRGAVYVEVIVCLMPVLVLFLGIVQMALLGSARLVVRHSAYRAARAAIVVLDDDPKKYGGAARGDLQAGGGTDATADVRDRLASLFAGAGSGTNPSGTQTGPARGPARLQAIRQAAYVPLAALAPSPSVFFGRQPSSLHDALATSPLLRFAIGALAYNRAAAIVTVREAPGSNRIAKEVAPNGDVTVHVTYLLHCGVPLVSRLACNPMWDLAGYRRVREELARLGDSFDPSRPEATARAMRELRERFPDAERFREIHAELARAESPGLLLPLLLGGGLFSVVEAEVTLPNQGARYHPPPRR